MKESPANVHLSEFNSCFSSNSMVIHNWNHHDGTRSLNFRMEEIKTFVKPPDRPLDEALRINNFEADPQGKLYGIRPEKKESCHERIISLLLHV